MLTSGPGAWKKAGKWVAASEAAHDNLAMSCFLQLTKDTACDTGRYYLLPQSIDDFV